MEITEASQFAVKTCNRENADATRYLFRETTTKTQKDARRVSDIAGVTYHRDSSYEHRLYPMVSTDATFGTADFGSHLSDIAPTFSCEQYA